MKRFSADNKYWIDDDNGTLSVGLTEEYSHKLGVFWTTTPKSHLKQIVVGQPLVSYESSKKLGTLRSPVEGILLDGLEGELWTVPEKIDHTTVLFKVRANV